CRNFILPDICKPCLFVFLRNLFYLTAERLKEYKEYIEDLPEKDTKRILKELAILEKIRAQK
ncbi:hypothetical protein, partial [Flavonifractor plautii]|uniref:hypothetical protein n=1 Tax=Flavonifractor plautii TaxID=292800 RepID=UPI00321B02E3